MANDGLMIKDVETKIQNIQDNYLLPIGTGANAAEVTRAGDLKDYVLEGVDTALEGKQDVISDLSTIRSGAALGATALQSFTETDPTVPSWAKQSSKPSYNYSEITGKPELSAVATSGSYNDLNNKPNIPSEQIQSDWNQSNTSAKDFIKNKPTIPVLPTLADVATSGDYEDLINTPTIPDITNCVQKSETAGLIKNDGTIDTNTYLTSAHEVPAGGNAGQVLSKVSATDYDTHWVNQTTTYPSAYSTTAGGTAAKKASCSLFALQTNSYVHILIAISNTNASALTLSINSTTAKPIYINGVASSATNYTLPAGTYIVFYDGTNYYFRTDGKIQGLSGTLVCTSSTSGLIKNDGTIDTSTYLTQHQDISGKADKATTLSGYGITDAKIVSGVITLGSDTITPLTSHQDISGKADKSEMSVSTSSDQTTITLKSGTSATVINQHQSLSGYVQTSSTAGLIKNDGTIDTTSYGTYSKPAGGIPASDIASGVIPDVSGKENTSNKVTSLSASSTDTQYPSAKCVWDLVGDIETILASI